MLNGSLYFFLSYLQHRNRIGFHRIEEKNHTERMTVELKLKIFLFETKMLANEQMNDVFIFTHCVRWASFVHFYNNCCMLATF